MVVSQFKSVSDEELFEHFDQIYQLNRRNPTPYRAFQLQKICKEMEDRIDN